MLRFPPLALGACAAAGLGLWLTRASLDVAPAGDGELRIAMFPSGVELGALIVLAAVVILLLARAARLLLRGTHRTALPADPLLPLLALPLLAVPYLPWLPDAVPALRVLSGPARFGLWMIILGQSLWIAWEIFQRRLQPRAEEATVRPYARASMVVLIIGTIAFGVAAAVLTRGTVYPAGDEPHFLVIVQSLVQDGDLDVADDYAERQYANFLAGALQPKVAAHDAASPLLPIGFPVLMAAPVAVGGYHATALLLALGAAGLAAAAWRWATQMTGSGESATAGWLGIAVSAPFVLHSFSFTPDLAAAAIVFTAVAWSPSAPHARGAALAAQSVLIGLLPWLSPLYVPLAAALAGIVALRQHAPRSVVLSLAPCFAVAAGAVLFHHQLWGSFLPTADGRASSHGAAAALAGMWIDQEYGLLPYAPAAVLGFAGLVSMWRHGGEPRRRAIESATVIAVLAVSLAALADWPGDALRPGQQLVPALLLLVVPLAWWDRNAAAFPLRRAAARVLILAGVAISAALVTVNGGTLSVNRSDGTSQLLEWLAPSRDLVRLFPSVVAQADAPWTVLSLVLLWLAAALIAVAVSRRIHLAEPGLTAVAAVTLVVGTGACVAAAAPAVMDAHLASRIEPAARAESSMLTRFDARRRPAAIAYDRLRRLPASAVPALFTFEGRPGLRRGPQPVRVLLNTRLALPAGDYEVAIRAKASSRLDGSVGLQVGRIGAPLESWHAQAVEGGTWHHRFRLDVDTPFVGFRAAADTERAVDGVVVRPLSVVNTTERLARHLGLPPVLAAARYGNVSAYFHGPEAYPEADGFWVRGSSALLTTLARAGDGEAVRLRVHTGAAANRVHLDSGVWHRTADLRPGEDAFIDVPLVAGTRQAAVRIQTESGFVPAETTGGNDRRRLGCWVEILE